MVDVKGMVQIALGAPQVPVGCADTWTAWERGSSKPVVDAVDVSFLLLSFAFSSNHL